MFDKLIARFPLSFSLHFKDKDGVETERQFMYRDPDYFIIDYMRARYDIIFMNRDVRLTSFNPIHYSCSEINGNNDHQWTIDNYINNDIGIYDTISYMDGRLYLHIKSALPMAALDQYAYETGKFCDEIEELGSTNGTFYIYNTEKRMCLVAGKIANKKYQELYMLPKETHGNTGDNEVSDNFNWGANQHKTRISFFSELADLKVGPHRIDGGMVVDRSYGAHGRNAGDINQAPIFGT